jgi:hypothetical protein
MSVVNSEREVWKNHYRRERLENKNKGMSKALEKKKGEKKIEHFSAIKDHVSGGKKSKGFHDPFWYGK